LKVADMARSVRFYVELAGFTVAARWDVDGDLRWCRLARGTASLMLQQFARHGHDAWTARGPVGEGVVLYFICADAVALYHELVANGVDASEPQVGNGMWETGIADPDGYALRFESTTDLPEETKLSDLG
jgi:catechol 2,3-dioxygenase-like lactoylglutathione lyase family enzyme